MAKIEVDEEQWNAAQRTLGIVRKIASNPANARAIEAMHKGVDPNVATPLADADKIANERVGLLEKQLADMKKEHDDERKKDEEERTISSTKAKWEEGRQKLRDAGFSTSAIEKIEKEIMEPKGIIDHEDALTLYEKANPPPAPVMPGGVGAWNFLETPPEDKDSDIKRLIETRGNSDVVADKMARDALNDFRQQVAVANRRR
jgi:hypothetical protein